MHTFLWLRRFEETRPFTGDEAWLLFRLAAIGEAVGWMLLIVGIFLKYHLLRGNDTPVRIAGEIHGTLFILYLLAAVFLYPSLGWQRWRAAIALIASTPPFGSLVYERIHAFERWLRKIHIFTAVTLYHSFMSPVNR